MTQASSTVDKTMQYGLTSGTINVVNGSAKQPVEKRLKSERPCYENLEG